MNFRLLFRVFLVGLCSALFANGSAAQSNSLSTSVIQLVPEVQKEIDRVVTVLSAGNMSEESVQKIVEEFMSFEGRSHQELLLQVLAVYGGKEEYRSNPGAEMAKRLMMSNLLQEMPSSDIVAAVAPKYEIADPKLQKNLRHALSMVIYKGGRVDPDFDALASYVAQKGGEPPQKLVGYMYTKSPDAALSSMARASLDKDEAKSLFDQVKNEDEAYAVDRLSKRPEWWAKLYAAEKMKQNPKLRDPELMKQLKKSENPVVSATIQEIEDEKK